MARTKYPRPLRVADVLQVLRQAAAAGMRCPTNNEIERQCGTLHYWETPSQLALKGMLVVELYGHNYRVVEIDGMRTAPSPSGGKPYRVYRKEP